MTKEVTVLVRNEEIDIGTSDVTDIKTFRRLERHIYVTAYDISEQRGVRLTQYTITLKNTT